MNVKLHSILVLVILAAVPQFIYAGSKGDSSGWLALAIAHLMKHKDHKHYNIIPITIPIPVKVGGGHQHSKIIYMPYHVNHHTSTILRQHYMHYPLYKFYNHGGGGYHHVPLHSHEIHGHEEHGHDYHGKH